MIRLDAATFLLQWAVGGLFFTWVTTRRREVGLGYGWLMRGVFGAMALASVLVAQAIGPVPVRDGAAYSFTGMLTSPKLMDPCQMARGMVTSIAPHRARCIRQARTARATRSWPNAVRMAR